MLCFILKTEALMVTDQYLLLTAVASTWQRSREARARPSVHHVPTIGSCLTAARARDRIFRASRHGSISAGMRLQQTRDRHPPWLATLAPYRPGPAPGLPGVLLLE